MLLAIDVGNSNTVLGLFEGHFLKSTWRLSTHPIPTGDELRARIFSLLELDGYHSTSFKKVVVSSVVPSMTAVLRTAFRKESFLVIDHQWPFSFKIKASPADQIGADRLVNAEAAVRDHGFPLIVVDSGTATTICAISAQCEYLGGAIMPGIDMAVDSLARKTAKLFSVELIEPARSIGTNTQEALRSGILFGYASMIDGMVSRFKKELNDQNIKVVATGGVSEKLQGIAQELNIYEPNLTLKGIYYLYECIRRQ